MNRVRYPLGALLLPVVIVSFVPTAESGTCGTPALLEEMSQSCGTDSPAANRPVLSGPEYTFGSPAGNFSIHWTDTGADSTDLDYAQSIASAADSSWEVQCDEMGFFNPPPDMGEGGDDSYDIYICHLTGGTLGYTTCSGEYHPPDSTHDCSASHMVMSNGIAGPGTRACAVAHQFHHAVQMAYDFNEAAWFMEECAAWSEEMVYPDYNTCFEYLASGDNALLTPWLNVCSYGCGGFPLPWMMWDRWGYESVRSIWEYCSLCAGNNTWESVCQMLSDHGTDFEDFFMDYGCWRWFTADNWYPGCGMYNQDASQWLPGPMVLGNHEVASLPYSGDQTTNYEPETWGIHWIRVDLEDYQDEWIEMSFDGRDGLEWNLGVIMQDTDGGRHYFEWYDCDAATGELDVSVGACGWDYAIFFPALISTSPLDHLYQCTITSLGTGLEGSPDVTDQLNLGVSSNPMSAGGFVTFNMPEAGNATLQVYDMSGRVAATLMDDQIQAGQHTVQFQGENLSSGTYFVVLEADGGTAGNRLVLLR